VEPDRAAVAAQLQDVLALCRALGMMDNAASHADVMDAFARVAAAAQCQQQQQQPAVGCTTDAYVMDCAGVLDVLLRLVSGVATRRTAACAASWVT
jgi:hypothetical protein